MSEVDENINEGIIDLIDNIDKKLPLWRSELIIPNELWYHIVKWFLETLNQKNSDRPKNLALFGNTDGGKNTFLNHIIPAVRNKYDLGTYGVVYVSALTNTTLKGLYHSILRELNWSYSRNMSIQELEPLVGIACQKRKCQLIVIDEFSQLQNNRDEPRQREVLKALRNIPKQTYRPLVIAGVKKVVDLLEKDPETNNRFMKVEFPRFELKNGNWRVLQRVVKSLDEQVNRTTSLTSKFSMSHLRLQTLFRKSKGKMGSMIAIYERAVRIALSEEDKELQKKHLDKAITILDDNQLLDDNERVLVEIPDKWWEN